MVRSAIARASASSPPLAMWAWHQRSPLSVMNSLPSADAAHAMPSAGSIPGPPDRCRLRPRTAESQPMPTAAGPNSAQRSSLTCAMCSISSRVRSAASAVKRTSIQLTSPPYSQVAKKLFGGSQPSIVPPALPSSW